MCSVRAESLARESLLTTVVQLTYCCRCVGCLLELGEKKWLRQKADESVSEFVLRFSVVRNNRTGPALLELHPERSRLSLNSPHQALVRLIVLRTRQRGNLDAH